MEPIARSADTRSRVPAASPSGSRSASGKRWGHAGWCVTHSNTAVLVQSIEQSSRARAGFYACRAQHGLVPVGKLSLDKALAPTTWAHIIRSAVGVDKQRQPKLPSTLAGHFRRPQGMRACAAYRAESTIGPKRDSSGRTQPSACTRRCIDCEGDVAYEPDDSHSRSGTDQWALRHTGFTGHRYFKETVEALLVVRPAPTNPLYEKEKEW